MKLSEMALLPFSEEQKAEILKVFLGLDANDIPAWVNDTRTSVEFLDALNEHAQDCDLDRIDQAPKTYHFGWRDIRLDEAAALFYKELETAHD